jgi:prepilin-type N-terminal cleavage/methylation domain-containing protein
MKPNTFSACERRQRAGGGFTLLEMMVTMAIFTILVGAMVSLQLYGLRVYTLAATKLTATASGRETLNDIRDRIRSAKTVYVGTYSNSTFSTIPMGQNQIGNALQIFPTTNTALANATMFYMDASTNCLMMVSNGVVSLEAKYMTNYYCFQAEDYRGNIMTNYINNPVICVTMQFYQWEFPLGYVGTGTNATAANAYDFYRLRTHITRRAKD